jgi:hypothetical protein
MENRGKTSAENLRVGWEAFSRTRPPVNAGGLFLWAAEDFVPPRVMTPVEMVLILRFDDLLKEDFNGTTK